MKNLIFLLVLGLILVSIGGCSDTNTPEPPIPPVVVIKKYNLTAKNDSLIGGTITPTTLVVDSGKSATFTITPDFGCLVKELKVNGTVVSLTTSNTYTVTSVKSDLNLVVTFKKTLNWYLIQKPWTADSTYWYAPDGLIYRFDLRSVKRIITFLSNGRMNASLGDNPGGDVGIWTLDENQKPVTLYDGQHNEIQKLDENIMVLNNLDDPKTSGGKTIDFYSHH